MSSFYILETKPLSEVSLANIFSHMVGSLFILLMFSLAVQKLFILMRSHSFILSFTSLAVGDISVTILLCGISEIFLPIFSSRTFMELQLIFKSFTLIKCHIYVTFSLIIYLLMDTEVVSMVTTNKAAMSMAVQRSL